MKSFPLLLVSSFLLLLLVALLLLTRVDAANTNTSTSTQSRTASSSQSQSGSEVSSSGSHNMTLSREETHTPTNLTTTTTNATTTTTNATTTSTAVATTTTNTTTTVAPPANTTSNGTAANTTSTTSTTTTTTTTMGPTTSTTPAPPTIAPSANESAYILSTWCASWPEGTCGASTVCAVYNSKCLPSCFRANHSGICTLWTHCQQLPGVALGGGCSPACGAVWNQFCDLTPGCSKPASTAGDSAPCSTYITKPMPLTGYAAAADWYMCEKLSQAQCEQHSNCVRFSGQCYPSCTTANHSAACGDWIHCEALPAADGNFVSPRCQLKCEAASNQLCEQSARTGGCAFLSTPTAKKCYSMIADPMERCLAWGANGTLPCFRGSGCEPYAGICKPSCDRRFNYGMTSNSLLGFGACQLWSHCTKSYTSETTGQVVCRPTCESIVNNNTRCLLTQGCVARQVGGVDLCVVACHYYNNRSSCDYQTHCQWNTAAPPVDAALTPELVGLSTQCQSKCGTATDEFVCEKVLSDNSGASTKSEQCVWLPESTATAADGQVYSVPAKCDMACSTLSGSSFECSSRPHCQWTTTGCVRRCSHAKSEQQCTAGAGFRDACMYIHGECMVHCLRHGTNGTACGLAYNGVCRLSTKGVCNVWRCDFMRPAQCQKPPPGAGNLHKYGQSCAWYSEKCQFTCQAAQEMTDSTQCPAQVIAGTILCLLDADKKTCTHAGCRNAPGTSMCSGRSACSWFGGNTCNDTCDSLTEEQCDKPGYAPGCVSVPTAYWAKATAMPVVKRECTPKCSAALDRDSCRTMRGVSVNTGESANFAPPGCFWDETTSQCLDSCFRITNSGGQSTCAAQPHCQWLVTANFWPGRCVPKCSALLSQTACNDRSVWQMGRSPCAWNPAASACELSCPFRSPCTNPCATSPGWGGLCVPPSTWSPAPTTATPNTAQSVTYLTQGYSLLTHEELRIKVLDAIGANHWAADVVFSNSYENRFRTTLAFTGPSAATWKDKALNLSSVHQTLLLLRCSVDGVASNCPTPPPPPPITTTPAPNTRPAVTFVLTSALNASKPETATALLAKLAAVLQIDENAMMVVTNPFAASANNTVTIAFLGADAFGDMDKALALTDAELTSLGAASVSRAEGAPSPPATPVQSDAYIVVAAIVGALFLFAIVFVCYFLLKKDPKKKKQEAQKAAMLAALPGGGASPAPGGGGFGGDTPMLEMPQAPSGSASSYPRRAVDAEL